MANFCSVILVGLLLCFKKITVVTGHGRMIEPASRNSMWRYNYLNARNYNDMGLNCGGFTNQFEVHMGKCGVCGDPWQGPREHEAGGKYARGLVARQYKKGSFINVTIELTSNHQGYFEYRLCAVNDPNVRATKQCFDRNLLNIVGHGTRYFISQGEQSIFIENVIMLPPTIECSQCVLQWKWVAGQSMGPDGLGGECLGCGNQENFINCADIAIGNRVVQPLPPLPETAQPLGGESVVHNVHKIGNAAKTYGASMPTNYNIEVKRPAIDAVIQPNLVKGTMQGVRPMQTFPPTSAPMATEISQWNSQSFSQHVQPLPQQNSWQQMSMPNLFSESFDWQANTQPIQQQTHNVNPDYIGLEPGEHPETNEIVSSHGIVAASNNANAGYMQGFNDAVRHIREQVNMAGNVYNSKGNNAFSEIQTLLQESKKQGITHISGPTVCPDGSEPECKVRGSLLATIHSEFDSWCTNTCSVGLCPMNICSCSCAGAGSGLLSATSSASGVNCRSVDLAKGASMNIWCSQNCKQNNCPPDLCICY